MAHEILDHRRLEAMHKAAVALADCRYEIDLWADEGGWQGLMPLRAAIAQHKSLVRDYSAAAAALAPETPAEKMERIVDEWNKLDWNYSGEAPMAVLKRRLREGLDLK